LVEKYVKPAILKVLDIINMEPSQTRSQQWQ
jgi:hypothetical protein